MTTGIDRAVAAAGSQQKLADQLGVTQQAVQQWSARGFPPSRHVVAIEALTGVPRKELIDPTLTELLDPPFTGE